MDVDVKKIIFNKLNEDLSEVDIILYNESIWFIDRKKQCWYIEFCSKGVLWWRYNFFTDFFKIFGLKMFEFEYLIREWVTSVLQCKIEHSGSLESDLESYLKYKILPLENVSITPNWKYYESHKKVDAMLALFK